MLNHNRQPLHFMTTFSCINLLQLGSAKTWISPEIISLNRLPMRGTLYPFPDASSARTLDRDKSPWFQLLNGTWHFKMAAQPEAVIEADVAAITDRSGWDSVAVP